MDEHNINYISVDEFHRLKVAHRKPSRRKPDTQIRKLERVMQKEPARTILKMVPNEAIVLDHFGYQCRSNDPDHTSATCGLQTLIYRLEKISQHKYKTSHIGTRVAILCTRGWRNRK